MNSVALTATDPAGNIVRSGQVCLVSTDTWCCGSCIASQVATVGAAARSNRCRGYRGETGCAVGTVTFEAERISGICTPRHPDRRATVTGTCGAVAVDSRTCPKRTPFAVYGASTGTTRYRGK